MRLCPTSFEVGPVSDAVGGDETVSASELLICSPFE
jgi:hypothetical protein